MLLTFLLSNNNGDGYENVTYIKSGFALLTTSLRLFHLVQFLFVVKRIGFFYPAAATFQPHMCFCYY